MWKFMARNGLYFMALAFWAFVIWLIATKQLPPAVLFMTGFGHLLGSWLAEDYFKKTFLAIEQAKVDDLRRVISLQKRDISLAHEACAAWMKVESEMADNPWHATPELALRADYRQRAVELTEKVLANPPVNYELFRAEKWNT